MSAKRGSFGLALLISLVLATAVGAFALFPETNCRITGTVSDEHGGKVAGATVYLTTQSGIQLTALTDQNGAFAFSGLSAGTYFLQIKADGFSTFSAEPIFLTRGQSVPLQIRLRVAALNETVIITATGTPQ